MNSFLSYCFKPSIESLSTSRIARSTPCYAFSKLDGSNLRVEWSKKQGFSKFGTRQELFDATHSIFGEAVTRWTDDVGPQVLKHLKKLDASMLNTAKKITIFGEFYGAHSFADSHVAEQHVIKVFDIEVAGQGFIEPKVFAGLSKSSDIYVPFLGIHSFNTPLIESVYESTFDCQCDQETPEGIILKHAVRGEILRSKLKTKAWLERLKSTKENWQDLI